MKSPHIILLLLIAVTISTFSQKSSLDTWSLGLGVNNFKMQGDLVSKSPNLGFYLSIEKMITPAFGFELKGQVQNMKGQSQSNSSGYDVLYTNQDLSNLKFEGDTFGGEFNLILNVSNFYNHPKNKLNFATYFGLGYHTYKTKLIDQSTNEVILDFAEFNSVRGHDTRSLYYNLGAGIKYNLTNRIDLELRQNFSYNNEDHLDAAISKKQKAELFLNTQLGIVIKLNKSNSKHIIWNDYVNDSIKIAKKSSKDKLAQPKINPLQDSDGDGVIDLFDKEKNTAKNALVYANGVTIDSDKDGIPDHLDDCPLIYGKLPNGCNSENSVTKEIVQENTVKPIVNNKPTPIATKKEKVITKEKVTNPISTKKPVVIVKEKPINHVVIEKLNEHNMKHHIFEIDNAVNYQQIEESPIYPGCENEESRVKTSNCFINKISTYVLQNFDSSKFSHLKLSKGTNLVRIILVVDQYGKATAPKVLGKWDDNIKKEIKSLINQLPPIKPGKLQQIPTPVKYSFEVPFNVK